MKIKEVLSQPTVLAHYDPTRETKVLAYVSLWLGSSTTTPDEGWKPVPMPQGQCRRWSSRVGMLRSR